MIANNLTRLGPKLSCAGEIVVQSDSGELPYVLRPHEDHYLFLGACYVDGAMRWQEEYDSLREELLSRPKQLFCIR
jgi:hypothetical protein